MTGSCPIEAARSAGPGDRGEIGELRSEAQHATIGQRGGAALWGRDRPTASITSIVDAALGGDDDALVVLGTLDAQTVGYGIAHVTDTEGCGRVGVVDELWVTPAARGIGVGEAMMDELEEWARKRGCRELDALALPGDRDTKNFFESRGLVARAISVSRRLD